ncbi:putative dephospho-CoA kinase Ecym_4163 [Eremothecium cymbalariae DBVPG|uniref:Dephospho-CoA kinase n=1 Tax=Eremothecium cymbalariae (strain CBS 270.75 / DBVPG 7215 / KCTC 17166 / NRRL Y-17582) TaxID=931890 RepID=G8JT87_ERECY|nr:hypothetical protein Ecym_4163 [Eremothecium cymbalariae DBVPG\
MLVVGLTGGIACGKSTVSKRFRERYKIPIIDADFIAREIMEPGECTYQKVVERFQDKVPDLVFANGGLNRPALGAWVFAHPDERKALNSITHPEIRRRILFRILACYLKMYPMCVLDIPLLFEAGMDIFCGVTISVVCDQKTQVERLMVRNPELTREQALDRIGSQMSIEERIERSDYVIKNNGNLETLYGSVDSVVTYVKPFIFSVILHYFLPFGIISALSVMLSKTYKNRIASSASFRRRDRNKKKEDKLKKKMAKVNKKTAIKDKKKASKGEKKKRMSFFKVFG